MEIPDDNKMIVFSSGIFIGLNAVIWVGGQVKPNSIEGEIEEWK